MKKLSEAKLAWLAGFIDGEGYIGLTFQRKIETKSSSASPRYHPYLIITSTQYDVIVYIKQLTGVGRVYTQQKLKPHKNAYQYKLTKASDLIAVLESLLPYLKLKNEQAKILIQYLKSRQQIKPKTGRGTRGVSSFTETDSGFYSQLLQLNKRGL